MTTTTNNNAPPATTGDGTTTTTTTPPASTGDATTNTGDTPPPTSPTEGEGGQGQGTGNEGDPPAGGESNDAGPPEAYTPFTLPDGMEFNDDRMQAAFEYAREQGWSQAQAQSAVDTYVRFATEAKLIERGFWAEQSVTEFGKDFDAVRDGATRSLAIAEKVRPGITERMEATSLGNHPDVLWLFDQLGKLGKERPMLGLSAESSTETPEPQSVAKSLYGATTPAARG